MLLSEQSAADKVILAANSHKTWNILPLSDRQAVIARFIDHFLTDRDSIAKELSQLIGRPHLQCNGEIKGFEQRARYLLRISRDALKDITPPDDIPGFKRYIKRESLGVVLIISAWNYPYLIMVNGIIPALLAGIYIL
jgi:acyl-CoA reductase-like NAD-dependent aldehyde dehydrogenase